MATTSTEPSRSGLDGFFQITERGSTVAREIRGGIVTFFTMAYIIVLNPIILNVADADGDFIGGVSQGESFVLVATATALIAGVLTILMGVVANFPLAIAAGLGLNAFVALTLAQQMTWADAMGLIVMEGLVILALVLTGFRKAVFEAVPTHLKTAISVGIGLFITLIGLVDAGFARATGANAPPIGLGVGGELVGWPVVVFCIGLLLTITLYARRVPGALLISILVTTVIAGIVEAAANVGPTFGPDGSFKATGWNLNVPAWPDKVTDVPDLGAVGEFSLLGSFDRVGVVAVILFVFTLMLADFFDTMGTMTAIGAEAGLNDDRGIPPSSQRILIVDSVAAAAGGAGSVSSNTSYIESAAGVGEGARTGLASVVTGVMFLLAMFFTPLVSAIPNEAAVPALVLVGYLMMTQIKDIPWDDIEIALPAFLTIVLMPFTYSISVGIGAGFLAYVFLKLVMGKMREVHPLLWIVAATFVIYFAINPITELLT